MPPPRRKVLATVQQTLTPPDELTAGQEIARAIKATGNNVYLVELPAGKCILVELPARFRSTIWIKRGSYVVVDTNALDGRENKLAGEIVNVVRDEKAWRKAPFWSVCRKDFSLFLASLLGEYEFHRRLTTQSCLSQAQAICQRGRSTGHVGRRRGVQGGQNALFRRI